MHNIIADFRRGKSNWDPQERYTIGALITLARDSAFRLLYQLFLGDFQSHVKDSNMAYQATLFVVFIAEFSIQTQKSARRSRRESMRRPSSCKYLISGQSTLRLQKK